MERHKNDLNLWIKEVWQPRLGVQYLAPGVTYIFSCFNEASRCHHA
jgi:hypothetical protein